MATLDDLLNSSMSSEILTPEQKQAKIDAVVSRAMPANLRQYGQTAQQQNEAAFGKGMGLSTWNAYQQSLNSLAQAEGAGQIANNAQQEVDAAQRAAIGNAASYATAEKNRAVQQATANQANQTMRRGQNMAQSGQTQGQIFQGLAGLAGGAGGLLGKEFKPEIGAGLRTGYNKLFGGGTPAEQKPITEQAPHVGPEGIGNAGDMNAANASPAYGAPTIPSMTLSSPYEAADYSTPSYGGGYGLDMPSYAGYGWDPSQFDLSSLFSGRQDEGGF